MSTVQLQYNLGTYIHMYHCVIAEKNPALKLQRSGFHSKLTSMTLYKYLNLWESQLSH